MYVRMNVGDTTAATVAAAAVAAASASAMAATFVGAVAAAIVAAMLPLPLHQPLPPQPAFVAATFLSDPRLMASVPRIQWACLLEEATEACGEIWADYRQIDGDSIEAGWRLYATGHGPAALLYVIPDRNWHHVINFSTMVQTNAQTGTHRRIRRTFVTTSLLSRL